MRFPLWLLGLSLLAVAHTHAAAPVVTNVRASQRAGTQLVDIYYNVSAATATVKVFVQVSADGGASFNVPAYTFTGAHGPGVTTGNDRLLTWNAGLDWGGQFSTACRVRVFADDGTSPPAPIGMAYIPPGTFQMGDNFYEGGTAELPVHNVFVSAFFMDKNLVNRETWLDVYSWAVGQGYGFNNGGSFTANGYPVHTVNWYDAAKWCNARSRKAGLVPCYYTDATLTTEYRTGSLNLTNACVKWDANGYRLPTEAEWEKAARGGLQGKRFPTGDTISHTSANYYSQSIAYDVSPTRGYHPTYGGATSPVGTFAANGYGLFDMDGNLFQWCWDWYDSSSYSRPEATNDPHGPAGTLFHRVVRGVWATHSGGARLARCAARDSVNIPSNSGGDIGFRCVRGL